MCGIVGVVLKNNSGFYKQTEDSFFELLFADTLRGQDATGVIAVDKSSEFSVAKEATEAAWFVPQFANGGVVKQMFQSGKAYIGHNRKATQGKATEDGNAHPFVIQDEFAMVHNGTLFNHKALANTEVDSEALAIVLCQAFENANDITKLEETLGKVFGAYAVAAYDQRHNKIFLLRNKERPLSIVETANAWYFASEAGMLYWILSRNNYTSDELKNIRNVPIDTLFCFDLNPNQPTKLTEVAFTPKKAISQPTTTAWTKTGEQAGHGATKTNTTKGGGTAGNGTKPPKSRGGLSKQAWKRLKKQYLYKIVEFWADDWVESSLDPKDSVKNGGTKVYLLGECSNIDGTTFARALVDLNELKIDLEKLEDYMFRGKIMDMEYNAVDDIISITLADSKLAPVISAAPPVIDAEYIRKVLDEKERKQQQASLIEPSDTTVH